jgi:hypothetical protein
MDTLRIFARKRAYSHGSRHYGGSAHFHAEASAQTVDFPSLLEQQNDLVKFAFQTAQIPSLLEQQNDLVKFAFQTSQNPSLLKQQNDLVKFARTNKPEPEPINTAKWTCAISTQQ